jgi:tubulin epsilon
MPREILTIQVGQCGNQMALAFWEQLLNEHFNSGKTSLFDESFSSFFKNVDSSNKLIPIYQVNSNPKFQLNKIENIKARTVIVDTEEGVINQIKKSKFGNLFEEKQVIIKQIFQIFLVSLNFNN